MKLFHPNIKISCRMSYGYQNVQFHGNLCFPRIYSSKNSWIWKLKALRSSNYQNNWQKFIASRFFSWMTKGEGRREYVWKDLVFLISRKMIILSFPGILKHFQTNNYFHNCQKVYYIINLLNMLLRTFISLHLFTAMI